MTDLNVTTWGTGDPVLMVHGSFSWGEETWAQQRPLAERYQLRLLDRRGFGLSPPAAGEDFEVDARDIAEALGDGAHLVGHSYGGVGTMLAAALRPESVWSMTVIEPPAFGVLRGNAAVERLVTRLEQVFERADDLAPGDFHVAFLEAFGYELPRDRGVTREEMIDGLSEMDIRAIGCSAHQRMPWEAVVPFDALASAPFPTLVVSGGWDRCSTTAKRIGGTAFRALCDVLEEQMEAERTVISGATHGPQVRKARAFNERLAAFLESASRERSRRSRA